MNVPWYLAVDMNGFVFIVDHNNCRVFLLSNELTYIRDVSRDQLKWHPKRLFLDVNRRRLYIAVNESKGRVIVVSV